MVHLLFSSAGRRVELINCFRQAAEALGRPVRVIAADADPQWSPACHLADEACKVPRCDHPDFMPAIADICRKHRVQLIIPTIDTELMVYAQNRERLASLGTEVLLSDPASVSVARDKQKTADVLRNHGIRTPKTWPAEAAAKGQSNVLFPLVLKPVDGSCGKGIFTAATPDEISCRQIDPALYVAQEICSGDEYTINAFYTRQGTCEACVPHYRKFIRAGEVCLAETVRIEAFTRIAHQLANVFNGLWGNICFQGFVDESGNASVFEINARFGGGYPICDWAGGTYARWILQDLMGLQPDYHDNWREGVRMLRYDAAVFVPARGREPLPAAVL